MSTNEESDGVRLLRLLKVRMKQAGLNFNSLKGNAPREINGLVDGSRRPTVRNLAMLSEAIWDLIQNPHTGGYSNQPQKFWESYQRDFKNYPWLEVPSVVDCEALKEFFYLAFGLSHLHQDFVDEEQGNEVTKEVQQMKGAEPPPDSLSKWAGGVGIRNLAIMFADIVNSTGLNSVHGDQLWRQKCDQHFDQARKLIRQYQGWCVKAGGDETMAVFHSAVDGINCAIQLGIDTGHPSIQIHSAVHVGQVKVTASDVDGNEVNLTARLLKQANAPGVCVSDRAKLDWAKYNPTQQLDWQDLGLNELKGIQEPQRLWFLSNSNADARTLYRGVLQTIRGVLNQNTGLCAELHAALNSKNATLKQDAESLLATVMAIGVNDTLKQLWLWLKQQSSRRDAIALQQLIECFAGIAVKDKEWLAAMREQLRSRPSEVIEIPGLIEPCSLAQIVAALRDMPAQFKNSAHECHPEGQGYVPIPDTKDLAPESDETSSRMNSLIETLTKILDPKTRNPKHTLAVLKQRLQAFWASEEPLYALFEKGDPLLDKIKLEGNWRILLLQNDCESEREIIDEPGQTPVWLQKIFKKLRDFENGRA